MMNVKRERQLSKQMSFVLRHRPDEYGIVLDPEDGYCLLHELVLALSTHGDTGVVTEAEVRNVVAQSDKQRFEIVGERIRARYGHSRPEVRYAATTPPSVLYHGTAESVWDVIHREGLKPMGRRYVHLSASTAFAALAGQRKGKLLMLRIDAAAAALHGVQFYDAGHDVWLVDHLPANYIQQDG
ncbi:RNA 2'-phosphotransferase [Paenibacillus campi]|uniref:RNA 2'-phosphotransferase n=1 Tax=Paenibacillus campi TaxID=3106031 RepID=UPI002AFE9E4E|nr:RNA 2'-phosphotransferase [Paenibacillus sp. SGZ-1014]